jgi:hypothetical protein
MIMDEPFFIVDPNRHREWTGIRPGGRKIPPVMMPIVVKIG